MHEKRWKSLQAVHVGDVECPTLTAVQEGRCDEESVVELDLVGWMLSFPGAIAEAVEHKPGRDQQDISPSKVEDR
jgi:hypothetical protein